MPPTASPVTVPRHTEGRKENDNRAATRTAPGDAVTRASKFMACGLRRHPDETGLTLGAGGWVPVEELLAKAAEHGRRLDAAMLERCVRLTSRCGTSWPGCGPDSASLSPVPADTRKTG